MAWSVVEAFHTAHEQLYGYCFRDKPEQQVEWVNLRVTGVGPIRRPQLRPAPSEILDDLGGPGSPNHPRSAGTREVCFDTADDYERTPTFWRPDLPAGAVVSGPAVIEEYGATVPLHPGFTATVDDLGNLVITRSHPSAGRS